MMKWTWGCIYLFERVLWFSSVKYWEVELLDLTVVLFLIFWGTSILLSIVAVPIYIPTNRAQDFHFLQILANTCACPFDGSHSDRCGMISHCGFDLHYPFPIVYFWLLCCKLTDHICGFIWGLSILFHWSLCLFLIPLPYCFQYYNFVI